MWNLKCDLHMHLLIAGTLHQVPGEQLQRLAPILQELLQDGTTLQLIRVGEPLDAQVRLPLSACFRS